MPFSVGLVGKPNIGKSTFFSAVTLTPVKIANYPFTTITPNKGIGYVRTKCVCQELGVKDNPINSLCLDGVRFIPVELIDTAGLVPDAWKGRGLGNQFLDEIRKADALVHVVDASGATDLEGNVGKIGSNDPRMDLVFLEREITMWLFQILKRRWNKIVKEGYSGKRDLKKMIELQLSGLSVTTKHVIEAFKISGLKVDKPNTWNDNDLLIFSDSLRKVSKPMLIAANKIDVLGSETNIDKLKESGYKIIPCSAEAELILRRASEKDLVSYKPGDSCFHVKESAKISKKQLEALKVIRELVFKRYETTGIQRIMNYAFFDLLDMIIVYPVEDIERLSDHKGRVLPDAHLVPNGTTAHQLAYNIHTDLGKGFIYAIDVRTKRRRGEGYKLKNGDVISIVSAFRKP